MISLAILIVLATIDILRLAKVYDSIGFRDLVILNFIALLVVLVLSIAERNSYWRPAA